MIKIEILCDSANILVELMTKNLGLAGTIIYLKNYPFHSVR